MPSLSQASVAAPHGTTRKLRPRVAAGPFLGSPLTQGTARQLRTCRTWPRLAWPSPVSTPILALLPTLKGTLWGQKNHPLFPRRQWGKRQRLQAPGQATPLRHTTPSVSKEGWGRHLGIPALDMKHSRMLGPRKTRNHPAVPLSI